MDSVETVSQNDAPETVQAVPYVVQPLNAAAEDALITYKLNHPDIFSRQLTRRAHAISNLQSLPSDLEPEAEKDKELQNRKQLLEIEILRYQTTLKRNRKAVEAQERQEVIYLKQAEAISLECAKMKELLIKEKAKLLANKRQRESYRKCDELAKELMGKTMGRMELDSLISATQTQLQEQTKLKSSYIQESTDRHSRIRQIQTALTEILAAPKIDPSRNTNDLEGLEKEIEDGKKKMLVKEDDSNANDDTVLPDVKETLVASSIGMSDTMVLDSNKTATPASSSPLAKKTSLLAPPPSNQQSNGTRSGSSTPYIKPFPPPVNASGSRLPGIPGLPAKPNTKILPMSGGRIPETAVAAPLGGPNRDRDSQHKSNGRNTPGPNGNGRVDTRRGTGAGGTMTGPSLSRTNSHTGTGPLGLTVPEQSVGVPHTRGSGGGGGAMRSGMTPSEPEDGEVTISRAGTPVAQSQGQGPAQGGKGKRGREDAVAGEKTGTPSKRQKTVEP